MRGKLTRTLLTVFCLVTVVTVAGSISGPTAAAGVLGLMLGGIVLIQVGTHDPYDRS